MDTRHMKYFLAVCEHLHFTKAADDLGISQPTLSQQIKVLEGELGMPLFDRVGKQVILTEAGTLLKLHGGKMLQSERDAKNAIAELSASERGTIRIGVLPSDLDFVFIPLFMQFHHAFPSILLQAYSTILIQEEVLSNKFDIGIGLSSLPDNRLVQLPLGSESYHLLVHNTSPLASRTEIELHELEEIPLVLYPKGYIGRDIVEAVCREHNITLTTVMETTTAYSILELVRAGIGAAIQPERLLRGTIHEEGLVGIPFRVNAPVRHIELIYRSDRFVSKAQKQIEQMLIDFFKNHLA